MAKKFLKIFLFSVILIIILYTQIETLACYATNSVPSQSWSYANNTSANTTGGWNFLTGALDLGAGVFQKVSGLDAFGKVFLVVISHIQRWLTGVSAAIFNMAFTFSIETYPEIIRNSEIINTPWKLLRDLINIVLIFIMLFISINTILGIGKKYSTKNLPSLVISAIMINFSMMIAKIVIDMGNRVATSVYNIITNSGQIAVGTKIINSLQLSEFVSTSFFGSFLLSGQMLQKAFAVLEIGLLAIVFWIFLYVSFLFIGRSIVLTMLLVTSPIGFIGGIIPSLSSKASEWWNNLIKQTLVAPFFLFFLYIVVMMLNKAQDIKDVLRSASMARNDGIDIGLIFFFTLIIGTLFTGVKMTKQLSGSVGGLAEKIAGTIATAILAVVTGGVAAAGRYTIGRAATSALAAGRIRTGRAIAAGGIRGFAARAERNALSGLGRATFNVRNTGLGNRFEKSTGINLGFGKKPKGGYKDVMDAREKYALKEASEIGPSKSLEELKKLRALRNNIEEDIRLRVKEKVGMSLDEATRERETADKKLKALLASFAGRTPTPEEIKNEKDARDELTKATKKLTDVTVDHNKIKDEVYTERGTSETKIVADINEKLSKVSQGVATRNQYADSIERGATLESATMSAKRRKDLAAQVRAQTEFKEKTLKQQIADMLKEAGETTDKPEGDKPKK